MTHPEPPAPRRGPRGKGQGRGRRSQGGGDPEEGAEGSGGAGWGAALQQGGGGRAWAAAMRAAPPQAAAIEAPATAAGGDAAADGMPPASPSHGRLWSRLPGQRELKQAGRLDLFKGLQLHGSGPLASALGITPPPLPAWGVITWEAVRGVIAASKGGEVTRSEVMGALVLPGGASGSHLTLKLREWCEQGRLLKVGHGRYCLPGTTDP